MPGHARGWPPVRSAAASGQREMTAATLQNAGPMAAGTGLTTSSLRHLLLLLQPRARTRRQPKNTDKAFRIFLVITLAHGEGREVRAIQRELRLTPAERNIAFVKLQRHRAAYFVLRLLHE